MGAGEGLNEIVAQREVTRVERFGGGDSEGGQSCVEARLMGTVVGVVCQRFFQQRCYL